MCLASPERTPSTKNPTFNDLLPIDDQNFDSGVRNTERNQIVNEMKSNLVDW